VREAILKLRTESERLITVVTTGTRTEARSFIREVYMCL